MWSDATIIFLNCFVHETFLLLWKMHKYWKLKITKRMLEIWDSTIWKAAVPNKFIFCCSYSNLKLISDTANLQAWLGARREITCQLSPIWRICVSTFCACSFPFLPYLEHQMKSSQQQLSHPTADLMLGCRGWLGQLWQFSSLPPPQGWPAYLHSRNAWIIIRNARYNVYLLQFSQITEYWEKAFL